MVTSSTQCDKNSYLSCEEHAKLGAESLNHLWDFSKSHLRLRLNNLKLLLALRPVFMNVRSCIRQGKHKQDISV